MNKLVKIALVVVTLLMFSVSVQAKGGPAAKSYKTAATFMEDGSYNSALRIFYNLLESRKSNANLNYNVGVCYYMIESDKEVAIPYLEKAVKSVTRKYKSSIETQKAPIFAHYYLGLAYQNSGDYEQAIEQFNFFKKLISPDDKKMKSWIGESDLQLVKCKNEKVKSKAMKNRASLASDSPTQGEVEVRVDTVYVNVSEDNQMDYANLLDSIHYLQDQVELYKQQFLMAQEDLERVERSATTQSSTQTPVVSTNVATKSSPKVARNQSTTSGNTGWYTVQVGAGHDLDMDYFNQLTNVKKCMGTDGMYRYTVGEFETREEADRYKEMVVSLGYTNAWVSLIDENRTNCE